MRAIVKHPRDFYIGLMYTAIGAAALWIAQDYRMGSAVRMGPGYFPTLLSVLLMAVGLASVVRGFLRKGETITALPWREIGLILGSLVLFGILVRTAGLVVAVVALVLVSARAGVQFRLRTALILAVATALATALIFVEGLRLPFALIGTWLK